VVSPFCGTGVQGQFWDQMEISSVNFQGKGVSAVPAAPPITKDKKLRLSIFIESSPYLFNLLVVRRLNQWA
jgi:hypothetical protein